MLKNKIHQKSSEIFRFLIFDYRFFVKINFSRRNFSDFCLKNFSHSIFWWKTNKIITKISLQKENPSEIFKTSWNLMKIRTNSSSHLHLSDNFSHLILQEQPTANLSAICPKSSKIAQKIGKMTKICAIMLKSVQK